MQQRGKLLEQKTENIIYITLPEKVIQLTQLQKESPFLQDQFVTDLQSQLTTLLEENIKDLDTLINALEVPRNEIYDIENFIREELSNIHTFSNTISVWLSIIQVHDDEIPIVDNITDQMQEVDQMVRDLQQQTLQYHTQRATYWGRLNKRRLYDIARTIVQNDVNFVVQVRNSFIDINNQLIIVYNQCVKNYEDLKSGEHQQAKKSENIMY